MSFKLGKSNIIFLALGLILFVYTGLYKNSNYKQVIYVSLILLSIALLLTLPILSIVWRFVPLMDYIQYPWRFINFISLFFSFLIAGIPFVIAQKLDRKFGYFAGIFIVIITILMNGKLFVPQSNNNFSSTYYTNEDYVKYTVSKISDEYLPHRFEKPQNPEQIPTKAVELDPSIGEEYIIENKPLKLLIRYETKKEGKLHINRAFYPSWKAYINNQNVLLSKHQRGMEVLLPKGNGVLQIRMESTGSQILGNSITLITLFALIVGIMLFSRKMYGK